MKRFVFIPMLLAAVALLAGCGSSDDEAGPAQPTAPSTTGSGLDIDDALAAGSDEPVLVRGYLLAVGGRVRLCDGFAESYPPQCVQPSLDVLGYKLLEQRQLYKAHAGVTWTEKPVKLLGTIADGTLTVGKNARE
jgi:hypothetical protein